MPSKTNKLREVVRNYSSSRKVSSTYRAMHQGQTLKFFDQQSKRCKRLTQRAMLMSIFEKLDSIVDESDPDTSLPQIFHAYQTGESLKERYFLEDGKTLKDNISICSLFDRKDWEKLPEQYREQFSGKTLKQLYGHITDWSWLPLVGFIHDLGKVLTLPEWGGLPQWAVVGDTFPLGAPFSEANVYYKEGFFKRNVDLKFRSSRRPNDFGEYTRQCGFDNVTMSWGHDEYLYRVLAKNQHKLPPEALYIIRYHSFYPWHSPRNNKRGYQELASDHDWFLLPLLKAFQRSDLYSKLAPLPNMDDLKQSYQELVDEFIPGRGLQSSYDLRRAQLCW